MRNRTISAACLVAISLLGIGGQIVPNQAVPPTGGVESADMVHSNQTTDRRQQEVVEWSVGRYELAGLQLPAVEIALHPWEPSMEACAFHGGRWTFGDLGHRIDVCVVGVPSRRRLLLHELAHAWSHENLTDGDRNQFLAERGLKSWNGPGADWWHHGSEQAAEIIKWGLSIDCVPQNMIEGEDQASLTAAFISLTGTEPLCEEKLGGSPGVARSGGHSVRPK